MSRDSLSSSSPGASRKRTADAYPAGEPSAKEICTPAAASEPANTSSKLRDKAIDRFVLSLARHYGDDDSEFLRDIRAKLKNAEWCAPVSKKDPVVCVHVRGEENCAFTRYAIRVADIPGGLEELHRQINLRGISDETYPEGHWMRHGDHYTRKFRCKPKAQCYRKGVPIDWADAKPDELECDNPPVGGFAEGLLEHKAFDRYVWMGGDIKGFSPAEHQVLVESIDYLLDI